MYSNNEQGGSQVPAFLTKLWKLVEDPSTNDLICWDSSGLSFHVYDQLRFAREVLPLYFKHGNIASFIRQLNMYGFRKALNVDVGVKVESDNLEFYHQYFQRDQEHLLENIKRKVTQGRGEEMKVKQEDVSKVLQEVRHMKGKQDTITNKMDGLKRENTQLWREVANLRQKHVKQQQIVNKLIQFLVTMVSAQPQPRNTLKRRMPLMLEDAPSIPKSAKLSKQEDQNLAELDYSDLLDTSATGPVIKDVTDQSVQDRIDVASHHPKSISRRKGSNLEPLVMSLSNSVESNNLDISNNPDNPDNEPTTVVSLEDLNDLINAGAGPTTSNAVSQLDANTDLSLDKIDYTDDLNYMDSDLDMVRDILSGNGGGTLQLDPSTLSGLFTPEAPCPPTPDHVRLLPPFQENKAEYLTSLVDNSSTEPNPAGNNIVGNEIIEYTGGTDTGGNAFPDFIDLAEDLDDEKPPEPEEYLNPIGHIAFGSDSLDTPLSETLTNPLVTERSGVQIASRGPSTDDLD
ncbi:unnamed protein product [Owenia fusiformis]|uniref:Uncharacterized protein n=1 Tax=Owenia fusiformis TaxID=6347 RepID=A0A8J1UU49_OWEFU|nr:unnamed protein product [Owenia fusiformis]